MGIVYHIDKPLQKYSYSGVNTFEQCGFKYYLQYIKRHFIYVDSLAADFGTLCHYILEHIGIDLKAGRQPDYEKYKNEFKTLNIPKKNAFDKDGGIYGIEILKKKYPREFFSANDNGESFVTKSDFFLQRGIYRLEEYLNNNPDWQVWGCEQYFDITFNNHRFGGFIDRVLYNKKTGEYIVEDIKTKDHPFKDTELVTPLQFVIYVKALADITGVAEDKITCVYDLPICDLRQPAGTKGFVKRGCDKLDRIFDKIEHGDWTPHGSPLCYFCAFCRTNPAAPEQSKFLCPYYCRWTRENKTFEIENEWEGIENHEKVMANYAKDRKIDELVGDLDF